MIVALPDLFVDIIVKIKKLGKESNKSEIIIKPGGNAANFSMGLSKLSVKHILLSNYGYLSKYIFENFLEKNKIKDFIDIYKINDIDCITVSIEEKDKKMYSYSEGIQIKSLDKFYDLLKNSKYIFFGNWNNNEYSNDLLQYLMENFKAKIYLDTGDLSIAEDRVYELLEIIKGNIWVLSINENELEFLSRFLNIDGNILEKANKLYELTGVENLDIHSPDFVYSLPSRELLKINKIENPKIITGAGDIWNSANFYGYINNFDNKYRLKFSNDFAKKYVEGKLFII